MRPFGLPAAPWLLVVLAVLLLGCARAAPAEQAFEPLHQCANADALAPKYCIADEAPHHLANVKEVLELLGYVATETPADANLIWAWRDPFHKPDPSHRKLAATHEHLRNLEQFQFVNQMPGTGYLATKPELAKLSAQLDALPRTFELPEQYQEWRAFVGTPRGAGMEWLRKDREHRGIAIIPDPRAPALKELAQPVLVQQLVRPLLIANRVWDVGVYVAITSLEPLLAYVFTGGALLRFCSQDYVSDITPDTPTNTYVIYGLDDYEAAGNVDAMKPHFADAGSDTAYGTTMALSALRSYLDGNGVDSAAFWLDVQATIVQVLQLTAPKMREQQATKYTGQRTSFFTLLRFDFMLDEHKRTYLIEVNMSPGLYRPDAPLEQQLLSRRLVHDLLSLKGLAPGGHLHQFTPQGLLNLTAHPDAVSLGEAACAAGCATACHGSPRCGLCRACRSEWQNGVLRRVMAEHLGSRGFMRIHPPHSALAQHMQATRARRFGDVEDRPDDLLVRLWVEAKCQQDFRWC